MIFKGAERASQSASSGRHSRCQRCGREPERRSRPEIAQGTLSVKKS